MSYDYYDKLSVEEKVRYDAKLNLCGLDQCPYKLAGDCWVNDPTKWPKLEYPEVHEYLINTPGVHTKEAMRNRKALEATNQFLSGWVRTVLFFSTGKTVILHAGVMPSQRTSEAAHNPWVGITKDAVVCTAHCDCMAGLGESCSHVAALLFKVEAAVRSGVCDQACTDQPCRWNNDFVKKVTPSSVADIPIYKKSTKEKARNKRRRTTMSWDPSNEDEKQDLLSHLADCDKPPIGFGIFKESKDLFKYTAPVRPKVTMPKSLREHFNPNSTDVASDVEKIMCEEMENETLDLVESATRAQAGSMHWKTVRVGRITASNAYDCAKVKLESPAASTVLKVTTVSKDISYVPAVKWGLNNEGAALAQYEQQCKLVHTEFSVRRPGLRLVKGHTFIGASADALSVCKCHGRISVEIKCPYRYRHITQQKELADYECLDENLSLRHDHRYYYQLQLQILAYGTDLGHFLIWTPNMIILQDVPKNEEFQCQLLDKLKKVYKHVIGPELVSRSLESCVENTEKEVKNGGSDDEVPCLCSGLKAGERAIGCDNDKCTVGWYHKCCVKVKRTPKGKWYCSSCKAAKRAALSMAS